MSRLMKGNWVDLRTGLFLEGFFSTLLKKRIEFASFVGEKLEVFRVWKKILPNYSVSLETSENSSRSFKIISLWF